MEPTPQQYKELYTVCVRLTQQFRWQIRWIEQVPGGEVVVVAQAPNDSTRRIIITIRTDGKVNYGTT